MWIKRNHPIEWKLRFRQFQIRFHVRWKKNFVVEAQQPSTKVSSKPATKAPIGLLTGTLKQKQIYSRSLRAHFKTTSSWPILVRSFGSRAMTWLRHWLENDNIDCQLLRAVLWCLNGVSGHCYSSICTGDLSSDTVKSLQVWVNWPHGLKSKLLRSNLSGSVKPIFRNYSTRAWKMPISVSLT